MVEDGGAQTVRVKATAAAAVSSDTTVTVNVGAAGGTAVLGPSGDYTRGGAGTETLTIANGMTVSNTADVVLTPAVDAVVEGAETIRFTGEASGFVVAPADLDIIEKVELVLSQSSVGEGAGNAGAASVTARFAGATSSELTGVTDVTLSFGAGEDAEAADFTAPGTAITVSIPASATTSSASALSALLITQDRFAEGVEKIDVGGSAAGFGVDGAELTIDDDDLGVTLTADTDAATNSVFEKALSEGVAPAVRVRAVFTDATVNDLSSALEVGVTAGESSPRSARGGGVDFTAPSSPVAVSIPTGGSCGGQLGEPDRPVGYRRHCYRTGGDVCGYRLGYRVQRRNGYFGYVDDRCE